MRLVIALVIASFGLFSFSSVAFGQPAPSVMPDAAGIASFCAALPPPNAPTRSGAATTRYQLSYANATDAFVHGRPEVAAPLFWQAFSIVAVDAHPASRALAPQIGDRVIVTLSLQGDGTHAQRCALLQCLVPRSTDTARAQFEQQLTELQCSSVTPPPNPLVVPPTPLVVRSPVPTPLVRLPILPILPPATPTRSGANWALHVSGWSVGALGLIGFGILGALCESANETATLANNGQTDGWDRTTHNQAQTFCTLANVSLVTGLAAAAATTTSFILTRPRLVPTVGPNRAGLTFSASF